MINFFCSRRREKFNNSSLLSTYLLKTARLEMHNSNTVVFENYPKKISWDEAYNNHIKSLMIPKRETTDKRKRK